MPETGEDTLRQEIVRYAREMFRAGLVTGTSGNLSARQESAGICFVTPSGIEYETMQPSQLVEVDVEAGRVAGGMKPSVDTPIHAAIYRARPEVGAVIHTHSPYAAAFSTLHRPIPPLITESAGFLGGAVRVMAYVPPAREDTGETVASGLGKDRAVLLPNHGVIAAGENLAKAFQAAMAVEQSARIAYIASQLGDPEIVPQAEVSRMHDFIHNRYGQP